MAPWADAAVVEGDRFFFVDRAEEAAAFAGASAEKIDRSEALVVPGFDDGHVPVVMTGAALLKVHHPHW